MSLATLTPLEPVARLSARVIRVLGLNPGLMTLQGTNTYIVGTGPRRILIDTGERDKPEYVALLSRVLRDEKVEGFDHILITHWHHDHIGGLDAVSAAVGPGFIVWKYPRSEICEINEDDPIKVCSLTDGQKVTTQGATLRVIHTPGHTTDHVSVHLEEDDAIFSGDSILGEGSSTFETLYDYIKSLEKLLPFDSKRIYPAHGPVIENPREKITEYIEHRNLRESQILNVLRNQNCEPIDPSSIVKTLYKDTPKLLLPAAERNVLHHLEKLQKENKVSVNGEKWILVNCQSKI
ncbi:Metallo-beta-lactamase superfamily [Nesidiocoris tenuis]|uniref:Metallo-beta-lactamase superfamily n=1 Tax=Nesidiocoris tenuis TaxID=355587 RepID=A0ABN7ABX4_9HEMI|nr:Metallo-beta-lactamase superfamily [Nesidiocoris tenuis]